MNKRYEYGELIYCDDDLSQQIDNYGGDLHDLFLELERNGRAGYGEIYYSRESSELYESYEDLIETEFCEMEVNENE